MLPGVAGMGIMVRVVILSVGGALGVNARYWLAIWVDAKLGKAFPWATFLINVSGACALGFLAAILSQHSSHHPWRLFAMVGFLGGYTTFSTFALESCTLWAGRLPGRSLAYMGASVAAGFVAVFLGWAAGNACLPSPALPTHVGDGRDDSVRGILPSDTHNRPVNSPM